jgi:TolA-binding protein
MKTTKQINIFLLLGAVLVIGLVAMGASNELQNAALEPADASTKSVVSMDRLLLEELQKTNYILLKTAEVNLEQQKMTTELLAEIKKLNEAQVKAQKEAAELNKAIADLTKSVDTATKNLGAGKNILSVNELLEDIKSILRNMN